MKENSEKNVFLHRTYEEKNKEFVYNFFLRRFYEGNCVFRNFLHRFYEGNLFLHISQIQFMYDFLISFFKNI